METATQIEKTTASTIVPKTDKQIVPQGNEQVNFDPKQQVEQASLAANALMSVMKQKKKKVEFNGEQYLEFEDWQTIAQFYNHTVGIEWTKPIEESGKIIGFEAKANLFSKGIVIGGAEAACMRDEGNWKTKPLFQLRSMAQTRAMAKALRSRFGFVAVLAGFKPTPAEEMDEVVKEKKLFTALYCSVHDDSITLKPAGKSKQGDPYPAFYSCSVRANGTYCKAPMLNSFGQKMRYNPETKELEVDQTLVEKTIEILNDDIPQ